MPFCPAILNPMSTYLGVKPIVYTWGTFVLNQLVFPLFCYVCRCSPSLRLVILSLMPAMALLLMGSLLLAKMHICTWFNSAKSTTTKGGRKRKLPPASWKAGKHCKDQAACFLPFSWLAVPAAKHWLVTLYLASNHLLMVSLFSPELQHYMQLDHFSLRYLQWC